MQGMRFDWRWIALIVVVAIIVSGSRVPEMWPVIVLTLAASGGYLLYIGWQVWKGKSSSASGSSRVTYWRGQRIELPPERPGSEGGIPPLSAIVPALVYLVLGGALVFSAVAVVARQVGA